MAAFVLLKFTSLKTFKIASYSASKAAFFKSLGLLVVAERIIEYRNQNGGIQNLDDLIKIKGIGSKKLVKIKEYLDE